MMQERIYRSRDLRRSTENLYSGLVASPDISHAVGTRDRCQVSADYFSHAGHDSRTHRKAEDKQRPCRKGLWFSAESSCSTIGFQTIG